MLEKWLSDNNFYVKNNNKPSHLLFNGGILYIPQKDEFKFLTLYASELDQNKKLYYVEVRPQIFKYMMDLDIKDDHYLSQEEIIKLSSDITKIVNDNFNVKSYVICCVSGQKIKNKSIHTGVHLIWPNFFVDSNTALNLRSIIIEKLGTEGYKWDQIIDPLIYTRNGFRMVGSDKLDKNKNPENRPLNLSFVLNPEGEISENYYNRLKKSTKSLVLETSIRYIIEGSEQLSIKGTLCNRPGGSTSVNFIADDPRSNILMEFISTNFPMYNGTIKKIGTYTDGNYLIITNSKYCLNIGRSHNSCGVFLFASKKGMCQKCLCPCDKLDGRKHGLCKDFSSDYIPFSPHTMNILFVASETQKLEDTCKCLLDSPKVVKSQKPKQTHFFNDAEKLSNTCDQLMTVSVKKPVKKNIKTIKKLDVCEQLVSDILNK